MNVLTLLNTSLTHAINDNPRVGVMINDTFYEITTPEIKTIEVSGKAATRLGKPEQVLILAKYYTNKEDENYIEF